MRWRFGTLGFCMCDSFITNKINLGLSIRSIITDANKSSNIYNVSVAENNNKYCYRNNFNLQPTRCNVFFNYLFLKMLYMFQAVPPPIIRSTQLHKQLQVLSTNTAASCYRGWDGTQWRSISSTIAASSSIGWQHLKLFVQFCSWWWAEEPPETCRASLEIDNSRIVASCWL